MKKLHQRGRLLAVVRGRAVHEGGPGGLQAADAFLQRWVPTILSSPGFSDSGLLVVTWDEANEGSTQGQGNWGIDCSNPTVFRSDPTTCQVTTILVSARFHAKQATGFYSHYSLTRAFEQNFGLSLLGGATRVTSAPIY